MYKAIIAATIAVLTAAQEDTKDVEDVFEDVFEDEIEVEEVEEVQEVLSLGELFAKNQEQSYSLMEQQTAANSS